MTAPPPDVGAAQPAEAVGREFTSRALVPVYAAHGMLHLFMTLYPGVLFVLRSDWGESYATLGAVYTVSTMAYGLGALPVGMLLNRVRPVTVVRIFVVSASLASLAIAVAPSTTLFAVALFWLGVSASLYHPAGLTLVSRASGNHPHMLAHHGMVGSIGLGIAPAFAGILASLVSWRLPFAVAGLMGLTLAVILTVAMPSVHDPQLARDEGRDPPTQGATHLPALVFVFAITMALGFIYRGFLTYAPSYAGTSTAFLPGSDLVRGDIFVSGVLFAGIFGQWLGGRLGARRGAEAIYAALLATTAALLLSIYASTGWLLIAMMTTFSVVHFATQPMDNVFTGKYTSLGRRGLGYGFSFALSFGVGSLAAWIGGIVVDAADDQLEYVFVLLAAVALVATGCAVVLWRLSVRYRASAQMHS